MRAVGLLVPLLLLAACGSKSTPSVASSAADTLTVTSDAFSAGGGIPTRYTCKGEGSVPTIRWSGDLRGAKAIAVVVDDPDAPSGTFVHRVVLDLPPTATSLGPDVPAGAHQAKNSGGGTGWTPPCPPSGTHHYRFSVYGLSTVTGLADGVDTGQAVKAVADRVVVQGRLTGTVSGSATTSGK
jgi:Raf kinase inhibitor-like YbhB/YbcL family protein